MEEEEEEEKEEEEKKERKKNLKHKRDFLRLSINYTLEFKSSQKLYGLVRRSLDGEIVLAWFLIKRPADLSSAASTSHPGP